MIYLRSFGLRNLSLLRVYLKKNLIQINLLAHVFYPPLTHYYNTAEVANNVGGLVVDGVVAAGEGVVAVGGAVVEGVVAVGEGIGAAANALGEVLGDIGK